MSQGLGDLVEKVIKKVVPEKIIEKVKKGGCGCGKRKDYLNRYRI